MIWLYLVIGHILPLIKQDSMKKDQQMRCSFLNAKFWILVEGVDDFCAVDRN